MKGIKNLIRNHYYDTRAMYYLTTEQLRLYPQYRKGEAIADNIIHSIIFISKALYLLILSFVLFLICSASYEIILHILNRA